MDELLAQYPTVIALMPSPFSSHRFILALAHRNQRAYVEALNHYKAGDAPFQAVHAQLSQALYDHPTLVRFLGKVSSPNIFGEPSECAEWERL